ncbi:hypothetical protein ACFL1X_08650 [Candidatus Hydrogenedentota bacterium]
MPSRIRYSSKSFLSRRARLIIAILVVVLVLTGHFLFRRTRTDETAVGDTVSSELAQETTNTSEDDSSIAKKNSGRVQDVVVEPPFTSGNPKESVSTDNVQAEQEESPSNLSPQDLELAITGTGSLQGNVIDVSTGLPVRDVAIFLGEDIDEFLDYSESTPDGKSAGDGSFLIDGLDPGPVNIVATHHPDYVPVVRKGVIISSGTTSSLTIELGGKATVYGNVSMDGRPLPNATITCANRTYGWYQSDDKYEKETDVEGNYGFKGINAGEYVLTVYAAGNRHAPENASIRVNVNVADGEVFGKDIALTSGLGKIEGVVTVNDVPQPGCRVNAYMTGELMLSANTTTDDKGFFRLEGLPSGSFFLGAYPQCEGADSRDKSRSSMKVKLKEGETLYHDIAFVTGTAQVSGRVFKDEKPLEDVTIYVSFVMKGRFFEYTTHTDSRGAYKFEGLHAGQCNLRARDPEDPEKPDEIREYLDIEEGESREYDIHFRTKGGGLRGRVTFANRQGSGVEILAVRYRNEEGKLPAIRKCAADNTGAYEMTGLSPGIYIISASNSWAGTSYKASEEIEIGDLMMELDLNIEGPGLASVSGYAFEDGNPIPNVSVQASRESFSKQTKTNTDGFYSFQELPVGRIHIKALLRPDQSASMQQGQLLRDVVLEEGESVELDLDFTRGTGVIVGLVSFDGGPATNFRVTAIDADGKVFNAGNSENAFRLENLPPGRYLVRAVCNQGRVWNEYAEATEGEETRINFDFEKGTARIYGRVATVRGANMRDTSLYEETIICLFKPGSCKYEEGMPILPSHEIDMVAKALANAEQSFEFTGLPAGEFDVIAVRTEYGKCLRLDSERVTLDDGDEVYVELDVMP